MKLFLTRSAVLGLIAGGLSVNLHGQEQAIPDTMLNRLPPAYREGARTKIQIPAPIRKPIFDFYAEAPEVEWRGFAFLMMARNPDGAEYLKTQLEKETSGSVRAQLFVAMESYFSNHPQEQSVLEKAAASDPDTTAALAALDTLRRIRQSALRTLIEARMKTAERNGEPVRQLRDEYLAHYMWYGEIRLPDFAYTPPPVFEVKPFGHAVRVLGFGDWAIGVGTAQQTTAAAMRTYHQAHPFDLAITMGDNFYPKGLFSISEVVAVPVTTPDDPRWRTEFEQLYGPMGIRFYPSIGNGDYLGLPAELAYTKKSQNWVFPAPYYSYTAGPIQFFAIDTIRLSDDQLQWLDTELGRSKARWKVVYGHYPIRTYTFEAKLESNDELVTRLLPVLKKNGADVSIGGHNHELQELEPDGSLHFFVSGGGGATSSGFAPTYKGSTFVTGQHGFSVIEADEEHLDMIFINEAGKEIHRSHITKSERR